MITRGNIIHFKMLVRTNNEEGLEEVETTGNLNNNDKMLLAAIDLMAEKGFKGAATKEIAAAAGVSEMTLFRHFGSKQNLLEAAVDRFHYAGEMRKIFNEKIIWDIQTDLQLISRTYHELMNRNRKLFLIIQKEKAGSDLPGFWDRVHNHPRQLHEMLTNYFTAMQAKGKMIPTNSEAQANAFMWMNHGAFLSVLNGATLSTNVTMEEFLETSVQLFTRALTP